MEQIKTDPVVQFIDRHWEAISCITVVCVLFGALFIVGSNINEKWEKIPYVDREVHTTVVIDEYTECVFLVDGERVITNKNPCKYKEGETVITKHDAGSKYISIYENRN